MTIEVGKNYDVEIGGKIVTARVDHIRKDDGRFIKHKGKTRYNLTILATGGKVEIRGEDKFHLEGEKSADPISYSEQQPMDLKFSSVESTVQNVDQQQPAHMDSQTSLNLASKIAASAQHVREVSSPVAGMVPNAEQESILAVAQVIAQTSTPMFCCDEEPDCCEGEAGELCPGCGKIVPPSNYPVGRVQQRCLVIGAGAGTGKTATLKMLEQVLPGMGQYTAFNASLVTESKAKFVKATCNTTHSLAFRAVGRHYQHRLKSERVKSYQIACILDIEPLTVILKGMGAPDDEGKPTDKPKVLQADFLAGQVTVAIKRFCQSADREVSDKHFGFIAGIDAPNSRNNQGVVRDYLLPFCRKAWADLSSVNGQLPFSHDCYVKLWQLGEGDNRPVIAADYILLDEYQDTAPVFLDVLIQQKHALLILVGDDNQRIYEWRGAVNAGDYFPNAPRRVLGQSYRFGQAVADVANAVLSTLEEPTDLVMRGMPAIPSRVAPVAAPRCYLYRTNAGAVSRVMVAIKEKKRLHLIGGGDDVVKWCQAAMDLQSKRGTRHPELCCFDTWGEVVEYSKTDEGSDMRLMVKLVTEFGADKIRDALKDMPEEKDADLVVSTAHKSKGREWDTVRLGPDFPTANKMTDPDRRLLYVAATRAKLVLDISECPPFCGGRQRDGEEGDGGWVPGLEIDYTVPMPTQEQLDEYIAGKSFAQDAPVPANRPVGESVDPSPKDANPANTGEGNGNRSDRQVGEFTWANFGGKWIVRGPQGVKVGQKVNVKRKNGTTSEVVLRSVVKQYDDAWLYGL